MADLLSGDRSHLLFGDEVTATASSATISECGRYRYELTRRWSAAEDGEVLWVMLNPSTADANVDDPTIRRCMGFSKAWGFGGLRVINLFALRATDPNELLRHADPVGPDNAELHVRWAHEAERIIVAWGTHKAADSGCRSVQKMYEAQGAMCLGKTKSGHPRHPLYVAASTRPEMWKARYG